MPKQLLIFILTLCMLMPALALAEEQIALPGLPAVIQLPDGVYSPVITLENLKENEASIAVRGGTVESWEEEFKTKKS